MATPRDWSPRRPLEFNEHEKKVFRDMVREYPEPERLWLLGGALGVTWGSLQWVLENKKVSNEVQAELKKIQRDIEIVLRGTPWWDQ